MQRVISAFDVAYANERLRNRQDDASSALDVAVNDPTPQTMWDAEEALKKLRKALGKALQYGYGVARMESAFAIDAAFTTGQRLVREHESTLPVREAPRDKRARNIKLLRALVEVLRILRPEIVACV